jgi:phosphoglycolate phosphatase-like HAD superfamily hydrolase
VHKPYLQFDFSKYDYLVFDCDGVILDSNRIKSQAFVDSLPNEPYDRVLSFVKYHKKHGGVSRYEKFKFYFENLKDSKIPEIEIQEALDLFAEIVHKAMLKCEFVPGALNFIKKAKDYGIPIFVVSGSDENELNEIFSMRCIKNLFRKVYGSPLNKNQNMEKVIKIIGTKKKGAFFGDSKYDYTTSEKYGLDFVFIREFSEWNSGPELKNIVNYINNFNYIILKNSVQIT